LSENYGFSALVSYGNGAGLGMNDFLDWFGRDQKTKAIVLYLEGIENGREFLRISKNVSLKKPVLVLKAGKTTAGKAAVSTHTGSLAGSYDIYKAAFEQAGLIECETLEEVFDSAKALAWQPRIKNGIAIVTNGGGYGALAADYCSGSGVIVSKFDDKTTRRIRALMAVHPFFSLANPLDILGDAPAERYRAAAACLLDQDGINGLIVMQTPQIMTETEKSAKMIAKAAKKHPRKAIVCVLSGGKLSLPGMKILEMNHIPAYSDPKRAVTAIRNLIK
jgi:acyl-CoA synthetase (NDP forming)